MRPRGAAPPFGEVFHHGTVTLAQNKVRLELAVGEGIFSGAGVDVGTLLLLRTLAEHAGSTHVVDLGCGYGPLGLGLAARSGTRASLVDRDAVAIAYAAHNAALNEIGGVEVRPALGWDDISASAEGADLVVSNVPAKAGRGVIRGLLFGGGGLVANGALHAIVVIDRIADEADRMLAAGGAEVLLRRENRQHVAIHYRLPAGGSSEVRGLAPHRRGKSTFSVGKLSWEAEGAWGLPEFDTLSWSTRAAVRLLRGVHPRPGMTAAITEPGAGHLALVAQELVEPDEMTLVSRDLLALRVSAENLRSAGPAATLNQQHSPLPDLAADSTDLFVVNLPGQRSTEIVAAHMEAAAAALRPAGRLIVAGSSTTVTRALEAAHRLKLPLIPLERSKDRGEGAADLVRR